MIKAPLLLIAAVAAAGVNAQRPTVSTPPQLVTGTSLPANKQSIGITLAATFAAIGGFILVIVVGLFIGTRRRTVKEAWDKHDLDANAYRRSLLLEEKRRASTVGTPLLGNSRPSSPPSGAPSSAGGHRPIAQRSNSGGSRASWVGPDFKGGHSPYGHTAGPYNDPYNGASTSSFNVASTSAPGNTQFNLYDNPYDKVPAFPDPNSSYPPQPSK